jgi:hypothetical protein
MNDLDEEGRRRRINFSRKKAEKKGMVFFERESFINY